MQRQQRRPDPRFLAGNERGQTARECMALARRLHDDAPLRRVAQHAQAARERSAHEANDVVGEEGGGQGGGVYACQVHGEA